MPRLILIALTSLAWVGLGVEVGIPAIYPGIHPPTAAIISTAAVGLALVILCALMHLCAAIDRRAGQVEAAISEEGAQIRRAIRAADDALQLGAVLESRYRAVGGTAVLPRQMPGTGSPAADTVELPKVVGGDVVPFRPAHRPRPRRS